MFASLSVGAAYCQDEYKGNFSFQDLDGTVKQVSYEIATEGASIDGKTGAISISDIENCEIFLQGWVSLEIENAESYWIRLFDSKSLIEKNKEENVNLVLPEFIFKLGASFDTLLGLNENIRGELYLKGKKDSVFATFSIPIHILPTARVPDPPPDTSETPTNDSSNSTVVHETANGGQNVQEEGQDSGNVAIPTKDPDPDPEQETGNDPKNPDQPDPLPEDSTNEPLTNPFQVDSTNTVLKGDNTGVIDWIGNFSLPEIPPRYWTLIFVSGAVLLLLLILGRRARKRKNEQGMKRRSLEETNEGKKETKEKEETQQSTVSIQIVEPPVIQQRAEVASLEKILKDDSFLKQDLREYWEDTAVQTVYLHRDSQQAILQWIEKHQEDEMELDMDQIEQIPEIGGFLLGKVFGEKPYELVITRFVPIDADAQNRYTLTFGGLAWSQLDDAMRENPDLKLVGWFHTHPGHGLFLSEADLREHSQLFRESYQIAMEVDPLSRDPRPKLETAFFTWKESKEELNNSGDRKQLHPNEEETIFLPWQGLESIGQTEEPNQEEST
ncbi:MAG: Mov34/MPN/PAD-1 family protein [Bacteroidota bacterium]